jgi:hypothetical protein
VWVPIINPAIVPRSKDMMTVTTLTGAALMILYRESPEQISLFQSFTPRELIDALPCKNCHAFRGAFAKGAI